MSEFKYFGWALDESSTGVVKCLNKGGGSGRKFAGAVNSLVHDRSLQVECAR